MSHPALKLIARKDLSGQIVCGPGGILFFQTASLQDAEELFSAVCNQSLADYVRENALRAFTATGCWLALSLIDGVITHQQLLPVDAEEQLLHGPAIELEFAVLDKLVTQFDYDLKHPNTQKLVLLSDHLLANREHSSNIATERQGVLFFKSDCLRAAEDFCKLCNGRDLALYAREVGGPDFTLTGCVVALSFQDGVITEQKLLPADSTGPHDRLVQGMVIELEDDVLQVMVKQFGYTLPATATTVPAPIVEAPAPIVEAPAPIVEAPAPIVEAPAPIVEAPAPIVEAPAPIVEAPPAETPSLPTDTIPAPLSSDNNRQFSFIAPPSSPEEFRFLEELELNTERSTYTHGGTGIAVFESHDLKLADFFFRKRCGIGMNEYLTQYHDADFPATGFCLNLFFCNGVPMNALACIMNDAVHPAKLLAGPHAKLKTLELQHFSRKADPIATKARHEAYSRADADPSLKRPYIKHLSNSLPKKDAAAFMLVPDRERSDDCYFQSHEESMLYFCSENAISAKYIFKELTGMSLLKYLENFDTEDITPTGIRLELTYSGGTVTKQALCPCGQHSDGRNIVFVGPCVQLNDSVIQSLCALLNVADQNRGDVQSPFIPYALLLHANMVRSTDMRQSNCTLYFEHTPAYRNYNSEDPKKIFNALYGSTESYDAYCRRQGIAPIGCELKLVFSDNTLTDTAFSLLSLSETHEVRDLKPLLTNRVLAKLLLNHDCTVPPSELGDSNPFEDMVFDRSDPDYVIFRPKNVLHAQDVALFAFRDSNCTKILCSMEPSDLAVTGCYLELEHIDDDDWFDARLHLTGISDDSFSTKSCLFTDIQKDDAQGLRSKVPEDWMY